MDLNELRLEIDRIDDEIIRLFCARMEVAAKIGEYKKANGLPVFVPEREQEKLSDVVEVDSLEELAEIDAYYKKFIRKN